MSPTQFRGWTIPGPLPPGDVEKEAGESLDAISGHWWIFQQKKGHRYSTDDVLCAWYACQWAPRVERYCDLGSGIGSVALMVAWRRPACHVVTIEAQEASYRLQRKSIRFNGLSDRFTSMLGDLRDTAQVAQQGPYDLVTGSPPYWEESAALAAESQQAVGARLETRGTVVDYARSASRLLAPGGVFVCVFQAARDAVVRAALAEAHLSLVCTRPVCFKASVAAEVSGARVYVAMRTMDLPEAERNSALEEPPLTIRESDGATTAEYARIKMSMGFPP